MLSAQLSAFLTPEDLEATLSTLRKIFDNIIQHPNDDKYRQIKLANKTFSSKVWRYPACEELMKMRGWVVEDDHVRLKDDSHVHIVSLGLNQSVNCTQCSNDMTLLVTSGKVKCDMVNIRSSNELQRILDIYSTLKCTWPLF